MLFKRKFDDHEDPFVYVETDANGNIIAEPWDNGLSHRMTFTGISIEYKIKGSSDYKQHYLVNDGKYDLYVTDSRLIFKLQSLKTELKFNGSLISYGIDALFKRSEDKAVEGLGILGHIRYEWVAEIMYFEKSSWKNNNMLRFMYYDREKTLWKVTITFSNDMDVKFLANEILHLACKYREKTTYEQRESTSEFIKKYKTEEIPMSADPKNNFSAIEFPSIILAAGGANNRPPL